jgi:hypothetical protein
MQILSQQSKMETVEAESLEWQRRAYAVTIRYRVHKALGASDETFHALTAEADQCAQAIGVLGAIFDELRAGKQV